VVFLVSKGAELSIRDNSGLTPVHIMVQKMDEKDSGWALAYFLAQGANPKLRTTREKRLWHMRARKGTNAQSGLSRNMAGPSERKEHTLRNHPKMLSMFLFWGVPLILPMLAQGRLRKGSKPFARIPAPFTDQASLDPEFKKFRDLFLQAIKRKDLKFLLLHTDPESPSITLTAPMAFKD